MPLPERHKYTPPIARTDENGLCSPTCDSRTDGVCNLNKARSCKRPGDEGPDGDRPRSSCPAARIKNAEMPIHPVGLWDVSISAYVVCPECGEDHDYADNFDLEDIDEGELVCPDCGCEFLANIRQ
jgi:hypothetical protein